MRRALAAVAVLGTVAMVMGAWAQGPPPPVPVQILRARSVFLANGGESCTWFTGPNRAYRDLYTALQSWGRYHLAAAPAGADLIFSVSFSCPAVAGTVVNGTGGGPAYSPALKLKILTPDTQSLLWTIVEPVRTAILTRNRDRNFDAGIQALVADLRQLGANLPVAPEPPKAPSDWKPKVIVFAVAVAVTVVLALVFSHRLHQAAMPPPPLPPPHLPPFPVL